MRSVYWLARALLGGFDGSVEVERAQAVGEVDMLQLPKASLGRSHRAHEGQESP